MHECAQARNRWTADRGDEAFWSLDMVVCGVGGTILCFHYEAICPNTVLVPSRCLRVQRDVQHTWLLQEVEDLSQAGGSRMLS